MVIFIGGLIGVGKTSLARALSQKLAIYYYDVDRVKQQIYPDDPNYKYNLQNNIPFSDETRIKALNKVVQDFETLSKFHEHIVVDETLHKRSLRQILFEGAKRYFGKYIVVWVKADDEIISKRLNQHKRKGHILNHPFAMYRVFKNQFEDLDEADIVFTNHASFPESIEELARLVKSKLT